MRDGVFLSPLKVDGAIDGQSSKENQKHNRRCERPAVIFGGPWVGPPTVMPWPTRAFNVSIPHRWVNVLELCRAPCPPMTTKAPAFAGPEEHS